MDHPTTGETIHVAGSTVAVEQYRELLRANWSRNTLDAILALLWKLIAESVTAPATFNQVQPSGVVWKKVLVNHLSIQEFVLRLQSGNRRSLHLAASPKETLPFLKERLRPAEGFTAAQEKQAARWIQELDNDEFEVREKASEQLAKLGADVVPLLRQALKNDPSTEVRRRLDLLLETVADSAFSGPQLGHLRAVDVLENIGSAEARDLLKKLAAGAADSRLTQEAKRSLERLTKAPNP